MFTNCVIVLYQSSLWLPDFNKLLVLSIINIMKHVIIKIRNP